MIEAPCAASVAASGSDASAALHSTASASPAGRCGATACRCRDTARRCPDTATWCRARGRTGRPSPARRALSARPTCPTPNPTCSRSSLTAPHPRSPMRQPCWMRRAEPGRNPAPSLSSRCGPRRVARPAAWLAPLADSRANLAVSDSLAPVSLATLLQHQKTSKRFRESSAYAFQIANWSFLTNHARALVCIAHDPGVRLRDIAATLDITERTAFGIVTDLTEAGYIVKDKEGRRNRYRIQADLPLRHAVGREPTIGEMLGLLVDTNATESAQAPGGDSDSSGPAPLSWAHRPLGESAKS